MGLNAISLLVVEALTGQPSGVDTNLILEHLKAVVRESLTPVYEFVDNNTIPQLAPTYIEDEELRNLYQISTSEHLQKLADGLLYLQQYPDDDTLRELQRSIHSLKGDLQKCRCRNCRSPQPTNRRDDRASRASRDRLEFRA